MEEGGREGRVSENHTPMYLRAMPSRPNGQGGRGKREKERSEEEERKVPSKYNPGSWSQPQPSRQPSSAWPLLPPPAAR